MKRSENGQTLVSVSGDMPDEGCQLEAGGPMEMAYGDGQERVSQRAVGG